MSENENFKIFRGTKHEQQKPHAETGQCRRRRVFTVASVALSAAVPGGGGGFPMIIRLGMRKRRRHHKTGHRQESSQPPKQPESEAVVVVHVNVKNATSHKEVDASMSEHSWARGDGETKKQLPLFYRHTHSASAALLKRQISEQRKKKKEREKQ